MGVQQPWPSPTGRAALSREDGLSWRREYEHLLGMIAEGDVLVLSGAGISTDSGIPDYRGPDGLRRVSPMTISEFRSSPANRQRYWARAYVGWPRFASARPNDTHAVVSRLQAAGLISGIITQNVDRLHQKAGSTDVIELHGTLFEVGCLLCGKALTRAQLDVLIDQVNPGLRRSSTGTIQPDGDVVVSDEVVQQFHEPRCPVCDSDMLKPQVVFFGDSVPREVVERCNNLVDSSRSLLVIGSSLQVMSGLRFVRRAATAGQTVAIVTRGPTRGDDLATIRVDASLGPVMRALAQDLGLPARVSDPT